MGLKGMFAPLTVALIGIIITVTIILAAVIFFFSFKYNLTIDLKFEYDKNFADMATLSLFRLNYNRSYTSYKVLSERGINGFDQKMKNFLNVSIALLTRSKCYSLSGSNVIIPATCPTSHSDSILLVKPYNPDNLVEKITLAYGEEKQ
ncbi:MAG: hypothetical protein ACTSX6_06465 [Candidatus Heimdallarchaeaceae archaeon]